MNSFDTVVYVALMIAVVSGFNAGLLRSVATIVGYLAAMPVAVTAMPYVSRALNNKLDPSIAGNPTLFFGIFLVAGSVLGVVRIVLVAVTMVLIFDRIIPPDRQPAFLAGSRLKPILLTAGQQG